ncbi:unnamed protein product [Litomosoides sigmodontis]|uniref:CDT1 Geminin-binding domain-containing protein n=1 Tax=Litomosoides sigmodontis TaxID=42156 RepID=A0A3P6UR87_LITSI|nr:unnamed protein product [Litomosoides sigmodontis]
MSAKKGRIKIRCKMTEADHQTSAAASSGQTKVIEYFRTVHRDPDKKFKRLKVFTENDEEKTTKHTLESPKKMARLKSPQTSEKEDKNGNEEWVLPVTYKAEVSAMSAETETNKAGTADLSVLPSAVKLVESIKSSTELISNDTLPLPTKYERLLRLFDYTEVASHFLKEIFWKNEVVSWLETQGKRITLNEVMSNVQRKLKSNYDEQQFAVILSIYPESYNIRCERRWMPIGGRHCNFKEYEYVIEPNLINDLVFPRKENIEASASSNSSPVKPALPNASSKSSPVKPTLTSASSKSSPVKSALLSASSRFSPVKPILAPSYRASLISLVRNPTASPSIKAPVISPTKSSCRPDMVSGCPPKLEGRRLQRKLEFKSRLHKLDKTTISLHELVSYLILLVVVPVEISPDEQLPRYHPDFDLDAVDDIIPEKLPEMPKGDAGQPETMREYLKAVPDSSNTLPEKIKMVIKELRSPEKQVAVVAEKCIPLSPKKYHMETKSGSKPSLLERIRAKERERKRREMMRNPEIEQKKGRLERISRSLLQCVCSYYNLKKVGSMKFAELTDKLAFGIGSISKVEIEAAINLLCEVCPTYFKVVEVRGEKYVHLKDNSFSAIQDIVNAEIKKCI